MQETPLGIVGWLCNASLLCIRCNYMKTVSKRQNTAVKAIIMIMSVTYACWWAHNLTDLSKDT